MSDFQGENEYPEPREERGGRGCLFWGCLIAVVLTLLVVIGVPLAMYFSLRSVVRTYTSDAPVEIATVELAPAEMEALEARFDAFKAAVEDGGDAQELVLTADEINALIGQDEDLKGTVLVRIEDGVVGGDVSIPFPDEMPLAGGRFFNATADFDVSMEGGILIVTLADATVNGSPLPQQFLQALANENLAKDIYKEKEAAEVLRKFDTITVEGDKIILKSRATPPAEEPAPLEDMTEEEPAEEAAEEPVGAGAG